MSLYGGVGEWFPLGVQQWHVRAAMLDIVQSLDLVMQAVLCCTVRYCAVQAGWLLPRLSLSRLDRSCRLTAEDHNQLFIRPVVETCTPHDVYDPLLYLAPSAWLLPHLPSDECPFST